MTDCDYSWRPDVIADLAEHRRRTEALLWYLDTLGLSARDRVPISAGWSSCAPPTPSSAASSLSSKTWYEMLAAVDLADGPARVLIVSGDLDDASAGGFVGGVLDAVMDAPTDSSVVLDLSQVEFCDGAGVLALAELERTLAPRPLILRSPRRFVTRLLAITDFQRLLGA